MKWIMRALYSWCKSLQKVTHDWKSEKVAGETR